MNLVKSTISKFYTFFLKKKVHCYLMTHSFANVLCLSIYMLDNCSCFNFRLQTYFKIYFLQINHPGHLKEWQTVWIQIKADILLVLIWFQTVCKGYRQMTKVSPDMKRVITGKDLNVQGIIPHR